jgi:hypothetical protein
LRIGALISPNSASPKRYRKPYDDSANIKLTDMKLTFLDYITNGLTDRPTSQRNEVLFFTTAHFLSFNFFAAAQVAHFVLPQTHKPTQRQNKKSHFFQRFINGHKLLLLPLNFQNRYWTNN